MTSKDTLSRSLMTSDLTKKQIAKDMATLSDFIYDAQWAAAADFVKSHPHTACGVNTRPKSFMTGTPFLISALGSQSVDVVRTFVEAGAPIEVRDAHGRTPLFCALDRISQVLPRAGWHEMVDYLFDVGCRADVMNDQGDSILSASNCDLPTKITKKLLEGGSRVDLFDMENRIHSITQLVNSTVASGIPERLENLKLILSTGVDLNPSVMRIEYSPLGMALSSARQGGAFSNVEVAELLIQHGADPLMRSVNGASVLFSAFGREAVDWVLSRHPELLNARNLRGQTALMVQTLNACDPKKTGEGVVETVMALIAAGEDLDAVDHQGAKVCKTPRMLIEACKIPELQQLNSFLASFVVAQEARRAISDLNSKVPGP